jgi:formate dehydrogenase gamma subunit
MKNEKEFDRFTLETRIQHIVLLITFFLLVITGYSLKYSDRWWAQEIVEFLGGWEMRAHIHHVSGITMVGLGMYHMIEYVLTRRKMSNMRPRFRDFEDFWDYVRYQFNVGEFPHYGHFDWKQKFEYWGVVWGTIVMGITGFILMFPFLAMNYIPYAWFNVAGLIHFYEATLATLVVFIWHFYNVHLNLDFPLQRSFVTGKIPEEMMKEEHRLEYEQLSLEKGD